MGNGRSQGKGLSWLWKEGWNYVKVKRTVTLFRRMCVWKEGKVKRRLKGWWHISCTVRGWGRKVVDILYSFSPLNTQSERLLDFVNNSCFISFHLAWDVRCASRCVIYFSNRNTSPRSTDLWVITELCLFSKEDANDRIKYVTIGCSSVIPNLLWLRASHCENNKKQSCF